MISTCVVEALHKTCNVKHEIDIKRYGTLLLPFWLTETKIGDFASIYLFKFGDFVYFAANKNGDFAYE